MKSHRRISKRRGYTIVELMMAVVVMAIGTAGIIAMQKVTATSNAHAKSVAIATHLAQMWQDRLAADAGTWNHPSPRNPALRDIATDTIWLRNVVGNANQWLRPAHNVPLAQGPAFTALGFDTANVNANGPAVFCTHIRLNWLYPDTAQASSPVSGNGLIRAEVRIFWLRTEGAGAVTNGGVCDPNAVPTAIGNAVDSYYFIHSTSAVKQATAS